MTITKPIPIGELPTTLRANGGPSQFSRTHSLSRMQSHNILNGHLTEWSPTLLRKLGLELLIRQGKGTPFPAARLSQWLRKRYPTGVALARATGLTPPSASRILRGATRLPDAKAMGALGLTVWVRSVRSKKVESPALPTSEPVTEGVE